MTCSLDWDVKRIYCYLFPHQGEDFILVPLVSNLHVLYCLLDSYSIEIIMKILIVILSTENVNLVIS